MEKHFAIGTLTHKGDNRIDYLHQTVYYFLENTNLPKDIKIHWYFVYNGEIQDDEFFEFFDKNIVILNEKYPVDFSLRCLGRNYGPGIGINAINEYLKEYKYSLFLEGDWLTLDHKFTAHDKDWLINCLDLMEKENLDQIQLRKYQHDVDNRQYGMDFWVRQSNIIKEENGLIYLKEREYTNNPHIRRNQSYYDAKIFPLDEVLDENGNPLELKGNPEWGRAEILAESKGKVLKSAWLKGGVMVHLDHFRYDSWEDVEKDLTGCDYDDGSLLHCKYGFMFPREEFCKFCDKSKDFTDLEEHNWRFERSLN